MKNRPGRRSFLKQIGVTGTAAALFPRIVLNAEPEQGSAKNKNANAELAAKRKYNGEYTNEFLNRVAFPIGGIGAGMFCMEGTGAISHMSVRNKPDIFNEPGMFAAISIKGLKNGAKILEGPVPDWKKFGQRDAGNGLGGATTGLPHFQNASFNARFPFGHLDLTDSDLPFKVQVTGWSPFIPTDEDNSSLPVAHWNINSPIQVLQLSMLFFLLIQKIF